MLIPPDKRLQGKLFSRAQNRVDNWQFLLELDEYLETRSQRDREIAQLLSLGYSDRDIREQLECSQGHLIRCKVRLRKAFHEFFREAEDD